MRKLLAALIVFSMISQPAFAASKAGTTGSAFLNLDVGARGIGMGSAFTSLADDASAIYWNPAGLARVKRGSASLMHSVYIADINYDFLSYAHRLTQNVVVAGGASTVGYGTIKQTDISGNQIGEFSPRDVVYSMAAAQQVDEFIDPDSSLFMGVTGKYFNSKIVNSASGWAVDVGGLLDHHGGFPYTIGFAVKNLGKGQQFDQIRDTLPVQYKVGGSARFLEKITLSADATALREGRLYGAFGSEFQLMKNEDLGSLALRGGYNMLTARDLEDMAGFNMGFGLSIHNLSLDYAFAPYGDLGSAHRVSLGLKF